MAFRLVADLVLALHFAFIVFAVLGALFAMRWPRAPLLHLPALVWAAWVELSGGVCPLTPLESRLRRAAGDSGYSGSFVEHYLGSLVYPPGLTHSGKLWLAAALLFLNLLLYGYVLLRRSRRRRVSRRI
jgi:hypothetical protein